MADETMRLAQYAAALRYEDLPPAVVQRAKDTITDTVATIIFGYDLPWSQIIVGYAQRMGAGAGKSRILGRGGALVTAPMAAFANGALAHAFELDNLTRPGAGVHPGATLLAPGLAIAQERGFGGRALITAFVAGAEAMIRIGRATGHTNEARGFHAPGTTGPFGGAIAAGQLMGFDAARMANALGIAGSLSCGLLEFARSGTGAMVKRLHLGRAAESGVLAASLAADGFTGPRSVLEGEFGFLRVFCREWDMAELTRDLGKDYVTLSILMKRFACHISAHTAVQAIEELRKEHGYAGADVASISITGNEKMAKVNNIPAPADVMMAQYSVPFSVALAHYRDPRDPRSFDDAAVNDPDIRSLCARITVTVAEGHHDHAALASTVTVMLKDGRVLTRKVDDFPGTPQSPLDASALREKFLILTRHCPRDAMTRMFERIANLELEHDLDWLAVGSA
jgi:2-methylcitrate dehydratase PrpD